MPGIYQACIVYNTANVFGLQKDAQILAESLPLAGRNVGHAIGKVKVCDSREPPSVCDICFHLEIPQPAWFQWARINVILVNTEWWLEDKWSAYWDNFDLAIFRDTASMARCLSAAKRGQPRQSMVVPWCLSVKQALPSNEGSTHHEDGFVWFIGGSANKRLAAEAVAPLWRSTFPKLTVCSVEPLSFGSSELPPNVFTRVGYLSDKECKQIAQSHPGHLCLSRAESFGYTAAESERDAAFSILNTLSCYTSTYRDAPATDWVDTPLTEQGFADFSNKDAIQNALDSCMNKFFATDLQQSRKARHDHIMSLTAEHLTAIGDCVKECVAAMDRRPAIPKHMPPLLHQDDCPPISVVTLVHGRPKFIDNAFLNIMSTDYPLSKIEWIVVDDSEPTESASDKIIQFGDRFPPNTLTLTYIPLARKRSIGYKRNLACERAKHNIILMMDDDDHYPSTSFRRRVAYLLKGRQAYECAACTTIAMYDLQKGVSAVNVPPYTLSLAERCSEATLTFTKQFWQRQKFPEVDIAEGERFLEGRCSEVVEMPPQQIIVAFSHGSNLSGRKIPDNKQGCAWGFAKPFLEFIHGLVGVKVEEIK
jgi:hypothetical protein